MNLSSNFTKMASAFALSSTCILNAQETKPNIVFIMVDQMRFDMMSCVGNKNINTPNLDKLFNEGVNFQNAYTPSPVCAPARAAVFSGMSPDRCGVRTNWFPFNGFEMLFPTQLKNNDYLTACVGKLHFVPHKRRWGFDYKRLNDAPYNIYAGADEYSDYYNFLLAKYGEGKAKKIQQMFNEDERQYFDDLQTFILGRDIVDEEDHMTKWATDESINFLKTRDKSKPFLLYTGYFGPHHPWQVPESRRITDPNRLDLPELEADYADKPIILNTKLKDIKRTTSLFKKKDYQRIMAAYYDNVMMLDDYIGKIFDELKRQNLWDDSLIIFTADHGEHGGHMGLFFKSTMLESSVRVPLIIKYPKQKASATIHKPISIIDLYGTILDTAKVKDWKYKYHDSGSLVNLSDEVKNENTSACFSKLYNLSMLRKNDYKLVRLDDKRTILYELYKIELNQLDGQNIANQPQYKKIKEELVKELEEILKKQVPEAQTYWFKKNYY